jgi:hypothetical protein
MYFYFFLSKTLEVEFLDCMVNVDKLPSCFQVTVPFYFSTRILWGFQLLYVFAHT